MTFTQLRAFLAVADTGSVRAAAEQLVVTQPAVSAALRALQDQVGVPLVMREGRGLRLTEAGTVYARYVRQVVGLLSEGAVAAAGRLHPERGRLRLAAVTTAAEHVLPPFLASFRDRFPEVALDLEVGNRRRVWTLLDDRLADLAVGGRPPADGRFVEVCARPNALVAVGQPRAKRSRPDPTARALGREVWLLREPGSGTRSTTEELFDTLGIAPRTLTLGSNGAVRASAAAGLGVTLISRDAVHTELERGELEVRPGPNLPIERSWHVLARTGEEVQATPQLFLDHLLTTGPVRRRFRRP